MTRRQINNLGKLLRAHRSTSGLGVRAMATHLGISPATLSRIERGYAMDAATLMKLWDWMLKTNRAER